MSNIHVLDQDTINKIAAGEVIERPMAVVKELTENAIDAGASAVTVEVNDGGKALIRVTDNGCGMEESDIPLAFTPHATSKIASALDLVSVSTLGFRGEALASIASVSRLEMVTKTRQSLTGYRYQIDGGEEKGLESIGCPEGTTFLVRNLFYNTPARLKFLKTSPTEAGYVNTLMERLALSRPDISFRFINQNQPKLHTSGNGNLKDVIYHIFGRDIASNLISVDASEVSCQVKGFIGKPVVSRGNRNFMNYFINGRYIKSATIQKAIEDAYQPYTMQHRYPFTVLHFTVSANMVDINVHPQKMEIRFTDAQGIYQSVYHAVSQALKHREFIPEVSLAPESFGNTVSGSQKTKEKPVREPEIFEKKRAGLKQEKVLKGKPAATGKELEFAGGKHHQTPKESVRTLDTWKKQEEALERKAESAAGPEYIAKEEFLRETGNYQSSEPAHSRKDGVFHEPEQTQKEDTSQTEAFGEKQPPQQQAHYQQQTLFEEGILSQKAQKDVRIIGQVFQTFWILQYEDAMYLVDQHAAHEKVLYERFMKQIKAHKPMTQLLQPPVILTLNMQEEQAVKEHEEIFEQLGFSIEPFGGREYAVTGVPAHLPAVGEEELLKEVIDSLVDDHLHDTPDILLDKVASMSCKAAVKGHTSLPQEQMHELLKELMTLENPYHCPHGRPTMIKMTKYELEKKFKRIV